MESIKCSSQEGRLLGGTGWQNEKGESPDIGPRADCQGNLGLCIRMLKLPCTEEASLKLHHTRDADCPHQKKMAEVEERKLLPGYPSTQPPRASLGKQHLCASFLAWEARLSRLPFSEGWEMEMRWKAWIISLAPEIPKST